MALERYPFAYKMPLQQKGTVWFDKYYQEKVVIIDEYEGQWPLDTLLQVLDRHRLSVPVKGGYTELVADVMVITSNSEPDTWYNYTNREIKYQALMRRINQTIRFTEEGVEVE